MPSYPQYFQSVEELPVWRVRVPSVNAEILGIHGVPSAVRVGVYDVALPGGVNPFLCVELRNIPRHPVKVDIPNIAILVSDDVNRDFLDVEGFVLFPLRLFRAPRDADGRD